MRSKKSTAYLSDFLKVISIKLLNLFYCITGTLEYLDRADLVVRSLANYIHVLSVIIISVVQPTEILSSIDGVS